MKKEPFVVDLSDPKIEQALCDALKDQREKALNDPENIKRDNEMRELFKQMTGQDLPL